MRYSRLMAFVNLKSDACLRLQPERNGPEGGFDLRQISGGCLWSAIVAVVNTSVSNACRFGERRTSFSTLVALASGGRFLPPGRPIAATSQETRCPRRLPKCPDSR